MTRSYDKARAAELIAYTGDKLGMRFGSAALRANLPMTYLAQMFGLTRNAVGRWYAGGGVTPKHQPVVETLIQVFEGDLRAGELPAKNLTAAREYIDGLKGLGIDCSK